MHRLALAACLFSLVGCIVPPNNSQRLTEAALDMNIATRFGRIDVALEHVGSKARQDFLHRHAAWGSTIRIADVEFGGFDMVKSDEAEVYLDVTWLRPDEATVRTTRIAQRWHDDRGHWELVDEERKDGEPGLLGEPQPRAQTPEEAVGGAALSGTARMGFQTRVIPGD